MSAAEIDRSNELLERSQVAKICGADVELGNFVLGADARGSAPEDAASALLREIDGIPNRACLTPLRMGGERVGSLYLPGNAGAEDRLGNILVPAVDAQDYGRKFLTTNGGCVYIDLNHLEICLPEVRSAWDHLACWHAMLRIVRAAQRVANAKLETGKIQVLVNNSDGQDSSYGSHLDFLITRRAWDNMFTRKLHPLLFLAAYQASSIVFAGQGKVGSENAAPEVGFQLSQRADFIETLVGSQTTFRRPLVNSRDEPLCGAGGAGRDALARLHVICYDSTLSHVAHVLKVGVMQIILAMIEAEVTNPLLALDDSVAAIRRWSHDATLQHRERLTAGKTVTAVELQRLFIEEARSFIRDGGCEGVVPRASEILELWDDTVTRLERGDFETLSRRLDWVLKLSILRSVAESRELSWKSPEMKHLDHLFASLDPDDGLFWSYERGGFVERLVSEAEIQQSAREPPADTRAWARTMLLRAAGPDRVSEVDWDCVRIRTAAHGWAMTRTVDLPDPRAHTQQSSGSLFDVDGLVTEIADSATEFERLH